VPVRKKLRKRLRKKNRKQKMLQSEASLMRNPVQMKTKVMNDP